LWNKCHLAYFSIQHPSSHVRNTLACTSFTAEGRFALYWVKYLLNLLFAFVNW
jgi:hypothetical protein